MWLRQEAPISHWSSEVRKRRPDWVAGTAQPTIAEALAREELAAAVRIEGEMLFIDYEATTTVRAMSRPASCAN
ncbi:hypothetical protein MESS2_1680026 [Mesorhizobium metallidurans STM 2683]|uniref:Uncharacterized protein n=2 Tax=Mesorhizobium TaxID=68287 RepID=A0A2P9ALC6_9HYPH|nr:hypothetical protein MESS2_1680026 [Mesorhizobium metallidurans STM 2683]SJM31917.1 conserved hypothetical protein [Mesorhizobium delmotii]